MHWAEPLAQVQQFQPEGEDIELSTLGEGSEQPLKKESSGCLSFFKNTWKKFIEIRPSRYDDLDSLERYYLSKYFFKYRPRNEFAHLNQCPL
ncbi:hypothetical protein TcasGA2_TC000286 [Tribolium castaneum]|uniref:Uncharacterized protein n=1 Tax=Tribolium castaneum TaxID=7070 RepID=D6WBC4_TRICA|nr:hypothetical protein TcasGA2_TC000286 [Tribolium castaneum]